MDFWVGVCRQEVLRDVSESFGDAGRDRGREGIDGGISTPRDA
jgi:hypothetical protein